MAPADESDGVRAPLSHSDWTDYTVRSRLHTAPCLVVKSFIKIGGVALRPPWPLVMVTFSNGSYRQRCSLP